MMHRYLRPLLFYAPPDTGSGTTENSTASSALSSGSSGGVTSGTASEAMIKAAEAASSADGSTGSPTVTGDPAPAEGNSKPPATAETPEQKAAKAAGSKPDGTAKPDAKGDAPDSRIQSAVKNARNQVIVDVADALGMDPRTFGSQGIGEIKTSIALRSMMREDPARFVRQLAGELGLTVSGGKKGEVDLADQELPEPDLGTQDGKQKAYSAERLQEILKIQEARILKTVRGEVNPLRQAHDSQETDRQERERFNQLTQTKDLALSEARKLPHFQENEDKISEKLAAMDPQLKRRVGPIAAMHLAYGQVLNESVFPTINTAAEQRVRDANKKKVAANGGADPVDRTGDGKLPPLRDGDVEGLAARMRAMAEQATA